MSLTHRLDATVGFATARRLIDGCFLVALAAALATCYWTGLPVAGIVAVAVASFGLEYVAGDVVADGAAWDAEWVEEPSPALADAVENLAGAMGIEAPRVIVDGDSEAAVNTIDDGDDAVLILAAPLLSDFDEGMLRGVVAHELAHVVLGHFRRFPVRESVTHVVGFTVFWVAALSSLSFPLNVLAGAAYLVAGLDRTNTVDALFYVVASLGVVLVPIALAAYAARLEECQADDVAVAHTSAADFCAGLYRVGTADPVDDAVAGAAPFTRHRDLLERLVAVHPTVEYRLDRLGIAPADVEERAIGRERPVQSVDG